MAKPGVPYEQVATACEALLKTGQTITLRAILAHTGGSPNYILKHWHKWQKEQEAGALKSMEDDFSAELKQAIRLDWARKSQVLQAQYDHLKKTTDQQLTDFQTLLDAKIKEKEQLRLDIAVVESKLRDEERKAAIADQRASDHLKDLKELEKNFMAAEKTKERALTEKSMLEKQIPELQTRISQLERQHQELQAEKHKLDLELATARAKKQSES